MSYHMQNDRFDSFAIINININTINTSRVIDLFYFITSDWFIPFVWVRNCLDLLVLSRLISFLKEITDLVFFSYKWLIYTTWIANKQLYITSASTPKFLFIFFNHDSLILLLIEDMTDLYYLLTVLVYLLHHDYLILKEMINEA